MAACTYPRALRGGTRAENCDVCGAQPAQACRINAAEKVVTTEVTAEEKRATGGGRVMPEGENTAARVIELLHANNAEVEKRRDAFRAAAVVGAYLENLLRHPRLSALLPDHPDPEFRHPLAGFEQEHVKKVLAFVRDPNGPNPFRESAP